MGEAAKSGKIKNENTYWKNVRQRFFQHKAAVAGGIIFLVLIVLVICLPFVMKLDPYSSIAGAINLAPSSEHWFGTDRLGRDLFARVVYGGRTSLGVGISATLISVVIGVPLGLIAAYFRGWAETIIMRLVDVFMSFPSTILILFLVAIVGSSVTSLVCTIGVLGWTQFARLAYSSALSVCEKDYVESAKAIGTGSFGIVTKYILPNAISPCLVAVTYRTASAILLEASLSFLGMGVQLPAASWGNLLYDAKSIAVLSNQPWVWIPSGLCLVITVLSINFFGDGLRDALDPKTQIRKRGGRANGSRKKGR